MKRLRFLKAALAALALGVAASVFGVAPALAAEGSTCISALELKRTYDNYNRGYGDGLVKVGSWAGAKGWNSLAYDENGAETTLWGDWVSLSAKREPVANGNCITDVRTYFTDGIVEPNLDPGFQRVARIYVDEAGGHDTAGKASWHIDIAYKRMTAGMQGGKVVDDILMRFRDDNAADVPHGYTRAGDWDVQKGCQPNATNCGYWAATLSVHYADFKPADQMVEATGSGHWELVGSCPNNKCSETKATINIGSTYSSSQGTTVTKGNSGSYSVSASATTNAGGSPGPAFTLTAEYGQSWNEETAREVASGMERAYQKGVERSCAGTVSMWQFQTTINFPVGEGNFSQLNVGSPFVVCTSPNATPGDMVKDAAWRFTFWATCANEGETCDIDSARRVRYGINGQFLFKENVSGPINCNDDTFGGNPAPGQVKICQYQ